MKALPKPGDMSDGYKIEKEVGSGGFGKVFCAFDPDINVPVAIKIANDGNFDTLEAEAKLQAKFAGHPKIIQIHRFDPSLERLVMEWGGESLASVMKNKSALLYSHARGLTGAVVDAVKWKTAVEIAIEVLHGLEFAHNIGTLHRDLKPGNILLQIPNGCALKNARAGIDYTVKIGDFGLAKKLTDSEKAALARSGGLNSTEAGEGSRLGSLGYIAPEQAEGKEIDGRADVYSLGAVLYEMLTEKLPFAFSNALSRANVPGTLQSVVEKMLQPDVDARFKSAKEAREALELVLDEEKYKIVRYRVFARTMAAGGIAVAGALLSTALYFVGSEKLDERQWKRMVETTAAIDARVEKAKQALDEERYAYEKSAATVKEQATAIAAETQQKNVALLGDHFTRVRQELDEKRQIYEKKIAQLKSFETKDLADSRAALAAAQKEVQQRSEAYAKKEEELEKKLRELDIIERELAEKGFAKLSMSDYKMVLVANIEGGIKPQTHIVDLDGSAHRKYDGVINNASSLAGIVRSDDHKRAYLLETVSAPDCFSQIHLVEDLNPDNKEGAQARCIFKSLNQEMLVDDDIIEMCYIEREGEDDLLGFRDEEGNLYTGRVTRERSFQVAYVPSDSNRAKEIADKLEKGRADFVKPFTIIKTE